MVNAMLNARNQYDRRARNLKTTAVYQLVMNKHVNSTIRELYRKGDPNADAFKELTADLVGDYLFTDTEFIEHLHKNNKNIFQKIFDEIKHLVKLATAGSAEERKLLQVKRMFEAVVRGEKPLTHKLTPQEKYWETESHEDAEGTQYSLSETTDGRFVAVVDNDILLHIDTSSWDSTKKDAAKQAASDALKQFSGGIVVDGITRKVNKVSRREYTKSGYTEKLFDKDPEVFADKMRSASVADDIVVATTNWVRDGKLKHPRKDNFVDFDHGKTLIMCGDSKYVAEVVVGITKTGEAVFYDVVDMTPTTFDIKKVESSTTATTQNAIGDIHEDSTGDTVPQDHPSVKPQFSLSDSAGRQLTEAQQEYFVDSKVRDENGNLLLVYHGTASGEFTIFDKAKGSVEGDFGSGFYFTDNEADVYDHYEGGGPDFENKVARRAEQIYGEEDIDYEEAERRAREELYKGSHRFAVYLNIKNPAIVGETVLFEPDSYYEEYDQDDYDSEDDSAYQIMTWA